MIEADAVLAGAVNIALTLLCVSFFFAVIRVIRGPTLPDRVLALDMLVTAAIGFIAVIGIKTGFELYLDIAIALGLVGFLATVAFARFIMTRDRVAETSAEAGAAAEAEAEAEAEGDKI